MISKSTIGYALWVSITAFVIGIFIPLLFLQIFSVVAAFVALTVYLSSDGIYREITKVVSVVVGCVFVPLWAAQLMLLYL